MSASWYQGVNLPNLVRNLVRRGYLLATYNDGKILRARVKTGADVENDQLDVIQPVGLSAHVAPGSGTEVLTLDVGADPSRRVVLSIFGDRATHPQPDEGEVFLYAPGDPTRHLRIKGKSRESRSAMTRDSGRESGLQIVMGDLPIVISTERTVTLEAVEGTASIAREHILEGDVIIRGNLLIEGNLRVIGRIDAEAVFAPNGHIGT